MASGVFLAGRNPHTGKTEAREMPDPKPGKRYLLVQVDEETHDKVLRMQGGPQWDDLLNEEIDRTIVRFLHERPVQLRLPRPAERYDGPKILDPRTGKELKGGG